MELPPLITSSPEGMAEQLRDQFVQQSERELLDLLMSCLPSEYLGEHPYTVSRSRVASVEDLSRELNAVLGNSLPVVWFLWPLLSALLIYAFAGTLIGSVLSYWLIPSTAVYLIISVDEFGYDHKMVPEMFDIIPVLGPAVGMLAFLWPPTLLICLFIVWLIPTLFRQPALIPLGRPVAALAMKVSLNGQARDIRDLLDVFDRTLPSAVAPELRTLQQSPDFLERFIEHTALKSVADFRESLVGDARKLQEQRDVQVAEHKKADQNFQNYSNPSYRAIVGKLRSNIDAIDAESAHTEELIARTDTFRGALLGRVATMRRQVIQNDQLKRVLGDDVEGALLEVRRSQEQAMANMAESLLTLFNMVNDAAGFLDADAEVDLLETR